MHLPNTTHILLNAKERQTTLLQEAQAYRQIRQVMQWRKAAPVSQLPSGERGFKMDWRRLLVGATCGAALLLRKPEQLRPDRVPTIQ